METGLSASVKLRCKPNCEAMVKLTCYGGVREIGGNKVLLEDGETRLFFDFGTSFAKRYRYFEEYLNPRAGAGLLDLLELGLLPPLHGLYRDDLILDEELWQGCCASPLYRELTVDGVLLSHAHLDHSGFISFLRQDIPIYTTAMTAFTTKAIQDSSRADFEKEVCYAIPKEKREGVLQSANWKTVPCQQRPFRIFDIDALASEAHKFWQRTPGGRELQPEPLQEAGKIGNLPLRCFPVDHSIFGAAAFSVETSCGWIVYSGDLRLHGGKGHCTADFVQRAAQLKPTALICEGTNVEESTQVSEAEVYANALNAVSKAKSLVIADFGPRNVERLLSFLQIAKETGRSLVISTRDAYLLQAMRHASSEVPDASDATISIYDDAKARMDNWEKEIRKRYQSKMATPEDIRQQQDSYILCFSFFDINELPTLRPAEGSIYLYSSSEAHNEEQQLDFKRLHNWLDHFKITRIGLPVEVEPSRWETPEEERGYHASGHASGPELLELIKQIGPKALIPIHTENPEYFRQLEAAGIEVRIPEEGQTISIS